MRLRLTLGWYPSCSRFGLRLHLVMVSAEPLKVCWFVAAEAVDVVAVRSWVGAADVVCEPLALAACFAFRDCTSAVPVFR